MSCYLCLNPAIGKACPIHQAQYEVKLRKRQAQEMERRAARIAGMAPGLATWLRGEAEKLANT